MHPISTPELQTTEVLNKLQSTLANDPRAIALLSELQTRLDANAKIEKKIGEEVAKKFAFATCTIDDTPFSNFKTFFEATLAQIGQLVTMVKASDVKADGLDYVRSRITEATDGQFDPDVSRVAILSHKEDAEARMVESFEPIVQMAQRVLSIETPKTKFRPDQIASLIERKKEALVRLTAEAEQFDAKAEAHLQIEVAEQIAQTKALIAKFKLDGVRDPSIAVSEAFDNYDDQLRFNLDSLEKTRRDGSQARQRNVRIVLEIQSLREEIAALELSLLPIKEKPIYAVEQISEETIQSAVTTWKEPVVEGTNEPVHEMMSADESRQYNHDQMKKFIGAAESLYN